MPLAFIDDSGAGGDSPYYVLAGYSATEPTWRAFWPLWQAVLDLQPRLGYFKMNEAEALKGQFQGFSDDQRTERVSQFIDVILAHDLQEASVAIPEALYRELLYPLLPTRHANPYYFAFIAMVTSLSGLNRFSGSTETMDFVFDEQAGIEKKARRIYSVFKTDSPHRQLGRVAYADDTVVLPLQAADLIAWQMRKFKCSSEPVRAELRRLHSGPNRDYRKTLSRANVQNIAMALKQGIPKLRDDYGDDRVDKFLAGIATRNRIEGIS